MQKSAIIISASSDIGYAMSLRWYKKGWKVFGTYRTDSGKVKDLKNKGVKLFRCDLTKHNSIKTAYSNLIRACPKWDILILCPGLQDPIGLFLDINFEEWEESVKVNFINQLLITHLLLPFRRTNNNSEPIVIYFAGGGTNNAPLNYSAYIVSKIALIKMTELLDLEIPDTRFVIIGPGWVKTKIHKSTLIAGKRAGNNYYRTLEKLRGDECTPMSKVLDCCDWAIRYSKKVVGGRNFSVVFDKWGTKGLVQVLMKDADIYKLRRFGNGLLVKNKT